MSATRLIFGCGYLGLRASSLWRDAGDEIIAATRSEERARELWEARLPSYRMADRTLDVTRDMTAADVAGRLADLAAPPLTAPGGAV